MFRFLVGLFTLITSFFGLWGSILADLPSEQGLKSSVVISPESPLSLSYFGSLSQLDNQDSKNIFDHLGCSCASCLQINQENKNISAFF